MRKNTVQLYLLTLLIALTFISCNQSPSDTYVEPYIPKVIPREVSRTSGVAPLSVHFTAGFTESTTKKRSFHDYEYSWDFGDPLSGDWETSGKSKNSAKGPVTTHIFDKPGTYQVTLSIKNGSGVIDSEVFNITVTDPDIVFSGDKTTCVSSTGDFTGAPSGARQITTTDLSTVTQYAGTGKRLLFRRGDSWTSDGLDFPAGEGESIIGSYGNSSSAPVMNLTSGSFINLTGKQNWIIKDLHLKSSNTESSAISGASNYQRILMYRLQIEGFELGIGLTHWNKSSTPLIIDQIVISDCDISGSYSNCIYAGGERIALLGNLVKNSDQTHVVRIWQGYKGVLSNNIISGASISSDTGRHALKFYSPSTKIHHEPESATAYLRNLTEFSVISDNVFGSSGPWPVGIGPQNGDLDERLNDVIFERNRIVTEYGVQSSVAEIALHIWARNVSIRNNIFDGTKSGNSYIAVNILKRGVEPAPEGVMVFNNTIYRADNDFGEFRTGVRVSKDVRDSVVKNNFVSFPGATVRAEILDDRSSDLIFSNNILLDSPGFFDPANSDPLLRDFRTGSDPAVIDQGENIPVFEDFSGNVRPSGNYDIGAFEY